MSGRSSRWRRWLLRGAPYAIAAAAIAAILYKYPPAEIAAEMRRGDFVAMIPYAVLLLAGAVTLQAAADTRIIEGTVTDGPGFWRVLRARCGIALLLLVGYGAGVGGYGVWLARVTGAGAKLSGGMVLYLMSSDLVAVSTVASISIWIGGADVGSVLPIAAPAIAATLVLLKMLGPFRLLGEERLPAVFWPWGRVPRWPALQNLALRVANIYLIALNTWAAANAFGMTVPLTVMTTYVPIVLVVGSMPVNVAGFGAVQGVWLLLTPWAKSGEHVLAFVVLWQLLQAAGMVLRGLPFVRTVVREVGRGA